MDAKAPSAEEGRGKLRKVRGSRKQALIPEYPNGETRQVEDLSLLQENILHQREPGELKHLSTWRRRKKNRFPE